MAERRILILKTGEALPTVKALYGDFEDWIALGMACRVEDLRVANVYLGDRLPGTDEISGVVITGSPAMVTEKTDWSEASARWLADLVETDAVPALGLCYGHQLLAHGLGGEVGVNPNGREMGTVEVTFPAASSERANDSASESAAVGIAESPLAPLFESGVFPGHMSHVESVLRIPSNARILARTRLDPHAAVEFGPRHWGVQFHPEFDRPIMQRYVEARREVVASEGLDPDRMIVDARDTPALSRVLMRFAELVDESG